MVRVKSEDWKGGHPPAAAGGGRGQGPQGAPGRGVRARGPREATSLPRSGASRDV